MLSQTTYIHSQIRFSHLNLSTLFSNHSFSSSDKGGHEPSNDRHIISLAWVSQSLSSFSSKQLFQNSINSLSAQTEKFEQSRISRDHIFGRGVLCWKWKGPRTPMLASSSPGQSYIRSSFVSATSKNKDKESGLVIRETSIRSENGIWRQSQKEQLRNFCRTISKQG